MPRIDSAALTKELESLCKQVQETERAETETLKTHRPAAVLSALTSEAQFWRFVTDPSTPYLDRMAAAHQGGSLIGVEQLPRLWKAAADFAKLPPGVYSSPCDFLWGANLALWQWEKRREQPNGATVAKPESRLILGRDIDLPVKALDYPLTQKERNSAPWLWQMRQMLPVLLREVNRYYAQPDRYPAMAEAALKWQTPDWYESGIRTEALLNGPRDAAWVERIVGMALQENYAGSAAGVATNLYVWGSDTYHLEELVHAAQIIILQRTDKLDVAGQTAYWTARLATDKPSVYYSQLKPLRTATAILAISRWALDTKLEPWNRYYSYAGAVSQIVDDPPFRFDQQIHDKPAEIAEALAAFEKWFAGHRDALQRDAAAERPHLAALAKELHRTID